MVNYYSFYKFSEMNFFDEGVNESSIDDFLPVTENQLDNIKTYQNIGLDTRPSMQLTLRLRGPK